MLGRVALAGVPSLAALLSALPGFAQVEPAPAPTAALTAAQPSVAPAASQAEPAVEPVPPVVISGEVFDGATHAPLVGVSISLDTGERALSDDAGRFRFENVTAGERTLTLSGELFPTLQTTETVAPGDELQVRYGVTLRPAEQAGTDVDDLELLIVRPKPSVEVVTTRVEAESARRVAGTQGDVLKVVENMPGVARAAVGSGDVIVWGAAPQDTRVYFDDVRIPALYHFGGFRSVVHSDRVASVALIPGAYGAEYGRGLGGLVTVASRAPSSEGWHGSAQLDLIDAGLAVTAPLGDSLRFAVSGRKSHLHEVLAGAYGAEQSSYLAIPEYHDASAALALEVSDTETVEVAGLLSNDAIVRGIDSSDPVSRRKERRELGFERLYARYLADLDDGSKVTLVPWFGQDRSRLHADFGGIPTTLDSDATLYGLRARFRGPLSDVAFASFGFDVEATESDVRRVGALSAPPREGDARVFGQSPSDQVNADHWKTLTGSAAPYAEVDVGLFDGTLHVVPGLRVEPFVASVNRRRPPQGDGTDVGAFDAELAVQPRLSLRYALHPKVLLKAAAGQYRQPAQPEDLSAVFGNPLLGTASAFHTLFGTEVDWTEHLSAETTVFYSESSELPVRNPLESPRVAEALLPSGEGRSYGMQLSLRRELSDGWMGWIAYTLLRSERRDDEQSAFRLFDYDQTHVLTALASYELGAGFEVGARVRGATGYPRTAVIGRFYDARRDQFEPVLGNANSERIPAFWQLDARMSKRWKLNGSELEAYLDVLNVTNRSNAEEVAYSADYRTRRYIYGLPILPVLGARWEL